MAYLLKASSVEFVRLYEASGILGLQLNPLTEQPC